MSIQLITRPLAVVHLSVNGARRTATTQIDKTRYYAANSRCQSWKFDPIFTSPLSPRSGQIVHVWVWPWNRCLSRVKPPRNNFWLSLGKAGSVSKIWKLATLWILWIPILMHGLEACPLKKSDIRSLDFVVDGFFMKLFKTKATVRSC